MADHRIRPRGLAAWHRSARIAWMSVSLLAALAGPGRVQAGEAPPAAEDPVLEARMLRITSELRCLVCQNQTVADSHSGLAGDMRQQVREMLQRGESDERIVAFMTERYGDFVLYRPPFKASTALLWGAPAVLLLGGLGAFALVLRRRKRLPPDAFEPEPDDLSQDPTSHGTP